MMNTLMKTTLVIKQFGQINIIAAYSGTILKKIPGNSVSA